MPESNAKTNQPENRAGNKKKKKRGVFILLLVIVVIVLMGVVNVARRNKSAAKSVKTVLVGSDDLTQEVSANGEIASREESVLVAKINGSIKELYVELGSFVHKGDPIALIDDEQILVQQKSAIASLEGARRNVKGELLTLRTSYTQAKSSYERAGRTYQQMKESRAIGAASEEQLNEALDALQLAEDAFLSARERLNFREGRPLDDPRNRSFSADETIIEESVEVKQAVANLNAINSNLDACDIKADITGVVSRLDVDEGRVVAVGALIAQLSNPELLEIIAEIDEVDIGNIRLGQKVKIESDSFLGRELEGEVSFIAPVIKRVGDSRVCQIKINFVDPENEAKVGASCSIFITVSDRQGVPVIPIEAYMRKDEKKYAFTLSDNAEGLATLSMVEIETGLVGIDNVEIVSGLSVGDEIVKEGVLKLSDGMQVRPEREKNDTAE